MNRPRKITKEIDWTYTASDLVNAEDIEAKIDELDANGATHPAYITKVESWAGSYAYMLKTKGNWQYLYYKQPIAPNSEFCEYRQMKTNLYKTKEEYQVRKNNGLAPSDCFNVIETTFERHNHLNLEDAFGKTYAVDLRRCVPKPLYYLREHTEHRNIAVHFIDVNAMYPSCSRGALPTTYGSKKVPGRVSPTEEYPFAFYLKSGHCAEYGVFDTHDYMRLDEKYRWRQTHTDEGKPIYSVVKDEDEITWLMKPAKYQLTSVVEEIYDKRLHGDDMAKAINNIGFGCFHLNPNNFKHKNPNYRGYYHIACVFEGRANAKQYAMIHKIEREEHGIIIQAIVDSLIYTNTAPNHGISEKVLGEYYDEFHGVKTYYRGTAKINQYVIFDEQENILKVALSGETGGGANIHCVNDIDNY